MLIPEYLQHNTESSVNVNGILRIQGVFVWNRYYHDEFTYIYIYIIRGFISSHEWCAKRVYIFGGNVLENNKFRCWLGLNVLR